MFVCEHGGAKSVIAAALFNARASARNLPFRAESRGIVPDATLSPQAVAGLRRDGLKPGQNLPVRITREDVDSAAVVIAFDALPPDLAARTPIHTWDTIPPVSVEYAAARDAMLLRIDALLDELVGQQGSTRSRNR